MILACIALFVFFSVILGSCVYGIIVMIDEWFMSHKEKANAKYRVVCSIARNGNRRYYPQLKKRLFWHSFCDDCHVVCFKNDKKAAVDFCQKQKQAAIDEYNDTQLKKTVVDIC